MDKSTSELPWVRMSTIAVERILSASIGKSSNYDAWCGASSKAFGSRGRLGEEGVSCAGRLRAWGVGAVSIFECGSPKIRSKMLLVFLRQGALGSER